MLFCFLKNRKIKITIIAIIGPVRIRRNYQRRPNNKLPIPELPIIIIIKPPILTSETYTKSRTV